MSTTLRTRRNRPQSLSVPLDVGLSDAGVDRALEIIQVWITSVSAPPGSQFVLTATLLPGESQGK